MENDKKISQDEKDVYIKYLNYAKDNIIEKQKNIVEHTIDKVSVKRTATAVTKYKDWITKNGYDGIKYDAYNDEHERIISIENYTDVEGEMYKPFLNKKINYSDEFKNKIFNLKRFIDSKNILKEYQAGESGSKEYGFLDYFNQAIKVDKLIDNHMKLQTSEEKRANLVKISHEVKNLERIEKEYDEVLNYIKENFNVDDIALCGNIYSGRVYSFNNDLSKFRPNLPEKWDNENAPYSAILSGFCQLMGTVEYSHTTLEEFFDDPINKFLNGNKINLDKVCEERSLKKEEAPLGKRIARTLCIPKDQFVLMSSYRVLGRGFEFLYNQCEENDQMYENYFLTEIGLSFTNKLSVTNDTLFGSQYDPDYDSLKNLFAFGNDFDNLYSVSKKYPFDLETKGVIAKQYENQIKSQADINPLSMCKNLISNYKSYLIETYNIARTEGRNQFVLVSQDKVLFAAKEYFKDYLLINKINPLDIPNEKDRKEVLDFLNNPVLSIKNSFNNNELNESGINPADFNILKENYNSNLKGLNEDSIEYFNEKFNENINDTLNEGKDIETIFEDNKGGYFERKIDTTSKEYKALRASVESMFDENSANYGDHKMAKFYAEKYLEHKLPEGVLEENLKENEKRRVQFCRSFIKTCNELERHNSEKIENENVNIHDNYENKLESYNNKMARINADLEYAKMVEIKLEPVIKKDINADFQENLSNDVNDLKVNKNDIKIEQNNVIEKNDLEEKM